MAGTKKSTSQRQNETLSMCHPGHPGRHHLALARWLVALEKPQDLTRMSNLHSVAQTFEYLTQLSPSRSYQFVLDAWMKPKELKDLRVERDWLMQSKISQSRLRQILTRILILVRRPDKDMRRRANLFRSFFCDFSSANKLRGAYTTAGMYCELEQQLAPEKTSVVAKERFGNLLFGNGRVGSSMRLSSDPA